MTVFTIKGLIRFSYPARSGFRLSKLGEGKLQEVLYAPERLERRFRLFETLCLHSLKHQKDQGFQFVVLIGEDMPESAIERLLHLLDPIPNAVVVPLPALANYRATQEAYKRIPDLPDTTHRITFRLDDDDALHRSAVARIRHLATGLMPLQRDDRPFAIAFNRGFYFHQNEPDRMISHHHEVMPVSLGSALVTPVSSSENIYRRNHRALGQFYNCYTEVSDPMFLRSVHQDNDSGAQAMGRAGDIPQGRLQKRLQKGFGLSFEDLKDLME